MEGNLKKIIDGANEPVFTDAQFYDCFLVPLIFQDIPSPLP